MTSAMTDTASVRSGPLSATEVAAYRRDGIVMPRHTLPAAQLSRLAAALEQLLADNPGVRPEKLVSAHIEHSAEGVKGNRVFLEIAHHAAVLDAVEQLIGPDIILWGCQVFCKPGGDGMEVPWHQDGQYWPIRPLATCTVWVAVDASTHRERLSPGHPRIASSPPTAQPPPQLAQRRGCSIRSWTRTPSTRPRPGTWSCSPDRCRCTTYT